VAEEATKIICITCPMGCSLEVTHEGHTITKVDGEQCKRGKEYAQAELTDPRRMVTSTAKVRGGLHPLVPVYTAAPIPKPKIFDLLDELRKVELEAPVVAGQIVLADALGTGIDVLASRDLPASRLAGESSAGPIAFQSSAGGSCPERDG
jgi:CxxC motif-containing protein